MHVGVGGGGLVEVHHDARVRRRRTGPGPLSGRRGSCCRRRPCAGRSCASAWPPPSSRPCRPSRPCLLGSFSLCRRCPSRRHSFSSVADSPSQLPRPVLRRPLPAGFLRSTRRPAAAGCQRVPRVHPVPGSGALVGEVIGGTVMTFMTASTIDSGTVTPSRGKPDRPRLRPIRMPRKQIAAIAAASLAALTACSSVGQPKDRPGTRRAATVDARRSDRRTSANAFGVDVFHAVADGTAERHGLADQPGHRAGDADARGQGQTAAEMTKTLHSSLPRRSRTRWALGDRAARTHRQGGPATVRQRLDPEGLRLQQSYLKALAGVRHRHARGRPRRAKRPADDRPSRTRPAA